ncbi:MAG: cytochrome b/b6 domain-containing protein [Acidimicrobiales bacterium]
MIALVLVVAVVVVLVVAGLARQAATRSGVHSIDRHGSAMSALAALSERKAGLVEEEDHREPASRSRHEQDEALVHAGKAPLHPQPRSRTRSAPGPVPHADPGRYPPAAPSGEKRGLAAYRAPAHAKSSAVKVPSLVDQAARVVGVWEPPGGRDPGVEANSRLTGTTGLVLMVLLFMEGLTIPFIVRLISWHIVIGLALVPPLLVKIGSTLWRFSRYYLGDPRYRRAGPPHPLLRVLGPLVMISTVVLMASGIALWLAGPQDRLLFRVHQLTFVAWFCFVAVHLASHLLRATRLAASDARDARARRPAVPRARLRRALVAASLVLGIAGGFAGRSIVTSGWTGVARAAPGAPKAMRRPDQGDARSARALLDATRAGSR